MSRNTPYTNNRAKPTHFRNVTNRRVVEVTDASYRNAVFSGVLELAPTEATNLEGQECKVQCKLSWYEWKPQNGFPKVKLPANGWRYLEDYTGPVIDRLG
jgi:hypothetical protein